MSKDLVFFFIIVVILIVLIILECYSPSHHCRPQYRRITHFNEAVEYLKQCDLSSRAIANTHLRDAFGIVNPFVISNMSFHNAYVKRVRSQLTQLDWKHAVDRAKQTVDSISEIEDVHDVRCAVRTLVMSVALEILGVKGYSYDELVRVGILINNIWIGAKDKTIDISSLREELYGILRGWSNGTFIDNLAGLSNVGKERAILSILIPAYETMYRVVLPLITHSTDLSFDIFLNPKSSMSTLNSPTEKGHSYLALIQETLRLYPVVKRIKRCSSRETVAIDVEAIHHDPEIWQESKKFRPDRWTNARCTSFIPFGAGRGRCIANEYIVGRIVCIVLAVLSPRLPHLNQDELQELLQNDRRKV